MTAVMLHVLWVASSRCTKNGGVPGTHCLHMCSNSTRCGVYGLLCDSSVLCDVKVWTLLSFLMSFSDLRPIVWFSSQSKEQVSRQCMRKKTFLFGYLLDLESQSAMKPCMPFVKLGTNAPCLALVYFNINIINGGLGISEI